MSYGVYVFALLYMYANVFWTVVITGRAAGGEGKIRGAEFLLVSIALGHDTDW